MSACTFFGDKSMKSLMGSDRTLRTIVLDLIENHGVTEFYVGNESGFDAAARRILAQLKEQYPHIRYTVVFACMPKRDYGYPDTLLPEGFERVPNDCAIPWRNQWMVRHSDYVVTSAFRITEEAGRAKVYAQKMGKHVIDISEPQLSDVIDEDWPPELLRPELYDAEKFEELLREAVGEEFIGF